MSKVKTVKELSFEAISKLNKIQTGENKLVLTGREYIDKHLKGLLPGEVLTLFAPSGVGKTEEFSKIFRNFLDTNINSEAKDYVSLEFNLEMQYLNLFIRDTARKFKKSKSEIIHKQFTKEEQELVKEHHKSLSDNRRFIVEETVTSKEFYEIVEKFCEDNKDKKAIFIGLDHCGLVVASERGEDPLEKIAIYINILKKKYKNTYFVLLTQMNRTYYAGEPKEKSNNNVPTTSMIYGASHFEFLSSYIVGIVNPFRTFGITEYMKVREDRYPNLSEFYSSTDKKGFTSFNTIGNLFYHILKLRDSDHMFDTLHIEKMDISKEQLDKMRQSVVEPMTVSTPTPVFEAPTFVPPNFNVEDAFS